MNFSVIIVLILLILCFKLTYGFTPDQFIGEQINAGKIDYYDFIPSKWKVSVCFIAGVHGNEPAGSEALKDLLNLGRTARNPNMGYFQKYAQTNNIKIRVIPSVNKWGLLSNTRYQPNLIYPDINRNFLGEGLEPTSQQIINLVENYDIVVDFHEGWGYHLINPESVGSTISPGNTDISVKIAEKAVNKINQSITDPYKKFIVLLKRSCEIPRTLSCHRKNQQKHYLLVETSGQNDIQPIEVRKKQVFDVVFETLEYTYLKKIIF